MTTNWDDPMFSGGLVSPNVMPMQTLAGQPALQSVPPVQHPPAYMSTPDGGVSVGVAPPPQQAGSYQLVDVPQAGGVGVAEDPLAVAEAANDAAYRQKLRQSGGGGAQGLAKQQIALFGAANAIPNPDEAQPGEPFGTELEALAKTEAARRASSAESAANMRSAAATREQEALDRGVAARDEAKAVGSEGSMYDRMDTGGKVASVLALMAGAYGSVRGTPGINVGQQVLTMFANSDAERQRRQYNAAKDKADQAATDYGRLRQAGLDDAAAFAETQARARHGHAMEAYAIANSKDADQATRMRAIELGDQIRDETRGLALGVRESAEHAADARRAALVKAAEAAKPRGAGGGADPQKATAVWLEGKKVIADLRKAQNKAPEGAIPVPNPDGGVDHVADKETGRKVLDVAAPTHSLRHHTSEAARILAENPVAAANPLTAEHKIVKEHLASAAEYQQHMRKMGVLRVTDEGLHKGLLGTSTVNNAALRGVLEQAGKDALEAYRAVHGAAVNPGALFSPSGVHPNVAPTPPKR